MPRNVRNFWIELHVDGKKTEIATGPRHAHGGFQMTIHMREDGKISERPVKIEGIVHSNGQIELTAWDIDSSMSTFRQR